ncbi:MAG: ATPase [Anaerolineae bacterium]|nr:ATPase [Anaerolineae bacterium]
MQRKTTGIAGLDNMLQGGFLPESANLVEGAPGTGKTTLGMQFVVHGITACDEPGLILTFEEFPQQYYRDAAGFGWDLRALEAENRLRVVMTSPELTHADLKRVDGLLERHVSEIGARRVLVDSLSHFERITRDRLELREVVFEFINGLKRLGLTAILTRESDTLFGAQSHIGQDMAFVADGYVLLRYVEIASVMHKALLVLKLRGSDHAKEIRQYTITAQGVEVQAPFEGQSGIMSGSPTPTMADAFDQAFGRPRRSEGV